MATPRKLENYSSEFRDIFKEALRTQQDPHEGLFLKIPFNSREDALLFRQRLYAYRTALLLNPSFDPYLVLLAPIARISIKHKALYFTYPILELNRIREALEKAK